jgi:CheY-like chemotaxis protein
VLDVATQPPSRDDDDNRDDNRDGGGTGRVPRRDRGITILVVDDDPDFLDSMRFVLETDGYRVVHASGGEQALSLLLDAPANVDLVILDLMMPRLSGWQVHDALKKEPKLQNIPVIVMTASGLRQGALGDTPILSKHINALLLLRRIASVLRSDDDR